MLAPPLPMERIGPSDDTGPPVEGGEIRSVIADFPHPPVVAVLVDSLPPLVTLLTATVIVSDADLLTEETYLGSVTGTIVEADEGVEGVEEDADKDLRIGTLTLELTGVVTL